MGKAFAVSVGGVMATLYLFMAAAAQADEAECAGTKVFVNPEEAGRGRIKPRLSTVCGAATLARKEAKSLCESAVHEAKMALKTRFYGRFKGPESPGKSGCFEGSGIGRNFSKSDVA